MERRERLWRRSGTTAFGSITLSKSRKKDVLGRQPLEVYHAWRDAIGFVYTTSVMWCTQTQVGMDIVLPVCDIQQKLSRDTVTAIFIQVKNADDYKLAIEKTLFDRMSPIKLSPS
jgi:hypothetical protein